MLPALSSPVSRDVDGAGQLHREEAQETSQQDGTRHY